MRIDWFTFAAQIVNFLILIGLLRHYLYGPLLDAMDRREERIAARLEEARQAREAAERARAGIEEERGDLDRERRTLLDEARAEAAERRRELTEEARAGVERLERAWLDSIRRERRAFIEDLADRAESQILATTRRVLRDLADAELEDRVVEVFLHRLERLDDEERDAIAVVVGEAGGQVEVRTRFPLPPRRRERIATVLSGAVGVPLEPRFETAPEAGFGIELEGDGHRIGWSLAAYLGLLEERVDAALEEALRTRVGAREVDRDEPAPEPAGSGPAPRGEP